MANRKNLAAGVIATAPSPATTGTSIVLEGGYGVTMPAVPFYITTTPPGQLSTMGNSEIMLVTALTSETLTVVRGQKGTTAQPIAAGWPIANGVYIEEFDSAPAATQETTNGTRTLFTVPGGKYAAGTLKVWVNGLMQISGTDFTETAPGSGTFTLDTAYPSTTKVTVSFQTE